MFQKFKDMYKLQKQAKQIKSELKNIHIEAGSSGIKVVVTAEQEIISIDIPPELFVPEKKLFVEKALKEALQKATKKAQEVGAEKMKGIMGDMGFPGM
ncbi:YbaB/EbfC family nucleoid-associated protein [Candidatus Peregrinibacteria bacterium]|nr:YbaB/EbfC family nucleoid-associated protein [Candidatus Peregrinibacteria bacterium]